MATLETLEEIVPTPRGTIEFACQYCGTAARTVGGSATGFTADSTAMGETYPASMAGWMMETCHQAIPPVRSLSTFYKP